MKKRIIVTLGLITLIYLGRQAYYYNAFKDTKELIRDNIKPVFVNTKNNSYENNINLDSISFDTKILKEGVFTCVENRCENEEFIIVYSKSEDPILEGPSLFMNSNDSKSFLKYQIKDEDIEQYLKGIGTSRLSDLLLYYTENGYKEVSFFSKTKDIKTAIINNTIKSVIEPTLIKMYIVDNNVRVYQVNENAYSIEWTKNNEMNSIMFKSDTRLTEEQLINFIDSIKYKE